jgi:ABC-type transport system involved in multi-copper enzyme maturation permease subunit
VIYALRAELLKMRSMPGVWVTWALALPLTVLGCLAVFAIAANGDPGHALNFPQNLHQRRMLLGAGYGTMQVLAPILGVLCITTEYRNKTITTSLILVPIRTRVIAAKVIVVALWSVFMVVLTLVTVAAVGLPWNAALGGSASQIFDQAGAVLPGLLAATVLLGLFGLGFGTLVKNQVAGILITIGSTFILEQILVALARSIFHYDLNWLPNGAGGALAGDIARGFGSAQDATTRLLTWWQGGLVMLLWGLVPLTIGYFTTFRRDVT